jgi:hypothetical protein
VSAIPKNAFVDLAGRVWLLKLNCGLATRIHDALGVDLANAHNGQAFRQLGSDTLLLIKTLTALIEPQLAEQKVSPEAFVEQLDDVVLEQASDALAAMIVLFTRPAIRPVLEAMITKGTEGRKAAVDLATEKLSGPAAKAMIDRQLATLGQKMDAALAEAAPTNET